MAPLIHFPQNPVLKSYVLLCHNHTEQFNILVNRGKNLLEKVSRTGTAVPPEKGKPHGDAATTARVLTLNSNAQYYCRDELKYERERK